MVIPYHRERFNCAHYAVGRINEIYGANITIEDGQEWQSSFLPYMRKHFKPIKTPIDNCLVVMTNSSGGLHLGIYDRRHVAHNYSERTGGGSVIMSDMGTIRALYKRVRFYAYNKTV
ncbi:hypothetical protein NVP1240O_20 [Vibrio phage 1.240.O._10N.261.52.F8]|nr:hypothetical protein NVP1240O_20 [Vibrio phage 1.240.O._10N.261.52.F8]